MPFRPVPNARASLKPGTLYAADGGEGWIYYGQVATDQTIGWFRFRTSTLADAPDVLAHPLMSRFSVAHPSIDRALRLGAWCALGRHDVEPVLLDPIETVQWPVGTLTVTVWKQGPRYQTRVEDPAIQDLEIIAAWDAVAHVPARLKADYGTEQAEWHVGGPIWRHRRVKEGFAARFPDAPRHQLPADWVPTEPR